MKKLLCILSALLILSSCLFSPKKANPHSVLSALSAKYRKHKSISYSVLMTTKYFNSNDTSRRRYPCIEIKDNKDTLFYGCVWLSAVYGHYLYQRYFNLK